MSSSLSSPPETALDKSGEGFLDEQKRDDGEQPNRQIQTESPQSIHSSAGPPIAGPEGSPPEVQNRDEVKQPELPHLTASTKTIRSNTGPEEVLPDELNRDEVEQLELPRPIASTKSIRSNTGPEEVLPDEQPQEANQPELPKIWDIFDDFQYAPPKPDGDPWGILLEPLMKKDEAQCNAWKDEVQNLLIFAGLFSAVVTAFIIESYKTLKPDPNDTIISLLSVIANRLDNTTTPIPILLSSTGPGLHSSPTRSSIRINNFWFISLVLSLTTVLVGTISLQWIREHQNYPNLPPRDTYALFNMRADGLKKWHIPKIFTALPLLLQSALVLFLAGIIDFLSAFGDIAVIIPVSVVTILVLLFLVVTTLLPTVQGILMCLPYPYSRTSPISPSQCPYKSPQAHAFRVMLSSVIQLCHKFITGQSLWDRWRYRRPINLVICVMMTWTKKTWTEFDMAWLQLRHQFMQRYDLDKGLFRRTLSDVDDDPPIFDLAQALMANISSQDTNISQNSLSAQYHCFSEISKWVTDRATNRYHGDRLRAIVQTNKYLRDIMLFNVARGFDSFTDFCNVATHVEPKIIIDRHSLSSILHQENLLFFFQSLDPAAWPIKEYDTGSRKHKLELAIRLSTHIHNGEYKHSSTADYPTFFIELLSVGTDKDNDPFLWQWVNIFSTFFRNAIGVHVPYTPGGTLQTSQHTPQLTRYLAYLSLEEIFSLDEGLGPAIQGKLIDTFRTMAENLNEQMSSPDFREPNLLFYLTGLYLDASRDNREEFPVLYHSVRETYHTSLDVLVSAMRTYKKRTIDEGIINSDLEEIYGRKTDAWGGPPFRERFSSEWWDFLDSPRDPVTAVHQFLDDPVLP